MDCELSLESDDAGDEEDEAGGEATKASSSSSRARALRWWSARCGVEEAGATNPSNPSSGDASSSSSGESGGGSDSDSDAGASLGPRSKNWHSPCGSFGGGPEVVLVSSEVATGALASFSKLVGGLTGMYVVYVLAVGSFARSFTTNLVTQIPYVCLLYTSDAADE